MSSKYTLWLKTGLRAVAELSFQHPCWVAHINLFRFGIFFWALYSQTHIHTQGKHNSKIYTYTPQNESKWSYLKIEGKFSFSDNIEYQIKASIQVWFTSLWVIDKWDPS